MTLQLRRDNSPIQMRNYGRIVQDMISYACTLTNPSERESLEVYIAQCMRQRNLVWNRDQEAGISRVRDDIRRLSNGQLTCESEIFQRLTAQPNFGMQNPKKKKK